MLFATDAHSIPELDHMRWGVAMARKGGVPADRVLNSMRLFGERVAIRGDGTVEVAREVLGKCGYECRTATAPSRPASAILSMSINSSFDSM